MENRLSAFLIISNTVETGADGTRINIANFRRVSTVFARISGPLLILFFLLKCFPRNFLWWFSTVRRRNFRYFVWVLETFTTNESLIRLFSRYGGFVRVALRYANLKHIEHYCVISKFYRKPRLLWSFPLSGVGAHHITLQSVIEFRAYLGYPCRYEFILRTKFNFSIL